MAISLTATCSECYGTVDLDIGPSDQEIKCPVCGHSVPNFATDDYDRIAFHQEKQKKATIFSSAAFGMAIVLFIVFLKFAGGEEVNQAGSMVTAVLSLASLIVSMWQGWLASAEMVVGEF